MDPKIMDVLKIVLMYHLTRFLADGIKPPAPKAFAKMEDRQNFTSRYGGDMITARTVATIINWFSGEENDGTKQFEREHPDIVKQAIERICAIQEFRDFLSWYVDIRTGDGLPQCKRRAKECGLYVNSSRGKDQLSNEMHGLSDLHASGNSSPSGGSNGNGHLFPIMTDCDTRVKSWLADEVEKLQSESQKEDWLTLREAINDKFLMSVPDDVFTMHMQFIHLQLLMGCVVKCCSGGLAEMRRNPDRYMNHMDSLTDPIMDMIYSLENGEDIASDYSDAFASSATRAAAAMIVVLQNRVLKSTMAVSAAQFLEQHLVATYVSYKEAVERVYCAGSPTANADLSSGGAIFDAPVTRTGYGCLLTVIGCAVGGWAVVQRLYVVFTS